MAETTPLLNPDSKYSIQSFPGDGVTTSWELQLTGGYIRREHIKAYIITATGEREDASIGFVNDYTISRTPAVPVGATLWVYRDTPKDEPLVNFTDGSRLDERSLDTLARQAVFIGAEVVDQFGDVQAKAADAATKADTAFADAELAKEQADDAAQASVAALELATATSQQFNALLDTVEDLSGTDLSGLARLSSPQTFTAPQVFSALTVNDASGRQDVYGNGTFRLGTGMGAGTLIRFNHWDDLIAKPETYPPTAHTHGWGAIFGKPATFPPDPHTHSWGSLTGRPDTYPPTAHRHKWSELDEKPDVAVNGQSANFEGLTVGGQRVPRITVSTSPPSGGQDGDIWFVV